MPAPLDAATACPGALSKNGGTYTDVDIYAPNSQYSDKNGGSLIGDFVIGSFTEGNNASCSPTNHRPAARAAAAPFRLTITRAPPADLHDR